MGLLDRFKKEPGPDALTWEAVARARATPGVAGAEPVDADTVRVSWEQHPGTSTLSLAEVRPEWTKASGFARIELMDQVIAGLAPPLDAPAPMAAPPAEEPPPEPPPPTTASGWAEARGALGVVVAPAGRVRSAARWPIAGGALEAGATLDGRPVTEHELASWGVGPDAVREAVEATLESGDPGLDPIGPGQPAWVPTTPADHPPLWLAAPHRLLAACGLPAAVVLAPTPTELVVVDPAAHDLLSSVLAGTRGIVGEAAEVLLAGALLVDGDGVREWRPAADHPCAGLVEELRTAG